MADLYQVIRVFDVDPAVKDDRGVKPAVALSKEVGGTLTLRTWPRRNSDGVVSISAPDALELGQFLVREFGHG